MRKQNEKYCPTEKDNQNNVISVSKIAINCSMESQYLKIVMHIELVQKYGYSVEWGDRHSVSGIVSTYTVAEFNFVI